MGFLGIVSWPKININEFTEIGKWPNRGGDPTFSSENMEQKNMYCSCKKHAPSQIIQVWFTSPVLWVMIHISRSTENPGFFLPTFPRKPKTSKAWTPAFWSTWLGVTPQHTWPPARALVGLKIDAPNSNGWSSFSLVACGYLMVPPIDAATYFPKLLKFES